MGEKRVAISSASSAATAAGASPGIAGEALARANIEACAIDLPGHGAAAGERFSFSRVGEALSAAVRLLEERNPQAPLTLVADSGGTTLVTAFDRKFGCYPLALVAPYVLPRATQIVSPRALRDNLRLLIANRLDIRGRRMEDASSNATLIAERRADPLSPASVDRRYVLTFGRAALAAVIHGAPGIQAPVGSGA